MVPTLDPRSSLESLFFSLLYTLVRLKLDSRQIDTPAPLSADLDGQRKADKRPSFAGRVEGAVLSLETNRRVGTQTGLPQTRAGSFDVEPRGGQFSVGRERAAHEFVGG